MTTCPCCGGPGVSTALTRRRPKRDVGIDEYLAFVRRILRALSRRVGDADLVALADMAALVDELDGHVRDAVARLRDDPVCPASWADIGRAFKIRRQTAQRRFKKAGGRRRPGGQQADWR